MASPGAAAAVVWPCSIGLDPATFGTHPLRRAEGRGELSASRKTPGAPAIAWTFQQYPISRAQAQRAAAIASATTRTCLTLDLKSVSVGTEITDVQQGIPDLNPVEACYLGWQESLRNLARLVEPETK